MTTDTIAAIATAPGAGGIGIVRVSGPGALPILEKLFAPAGKGDYKPWILRRGRVQDTEGNTLDDSLAVFMPGPKTFTGEDVAEFQCHGGPVLLAAVLEACLCAGARLAERGEFTRRAFLNGRMDLTQAEAVAEMIAAPSKEGARLAAAKLDGVLGQRIGDLRERVEHLRAQICLAVDFPEEEVECLPQEGFLSAIAAVASLLAGFERTRCWREGVTVALAGPVNAGKSSLMNALLGRQRAVVTEYPGTTRDFLEEPIQLAGLPVRLVDTAGLRETDNPAEAQGIQLGRSMIESADVVLLMVDGTEGTTPDTWALLSELGPERTILVWNKSDLATPPPHWYGKETNLSVKPAAHAVISARKGEGLETLAEAVRELALARSQGQEPEPGEAVPNLRQARSLMEVLGELEALEQDVLAGVPYDLCAVRLEGAASALAEITGLDTPEEVLNRIFASFCIGK